MKYLGKNALVALRRFLHENFPTLWMLAGAGPIAHRFNFQCQRKTYSGYNLKASERCMCASCWKMLLLMRAWSGCGGDKRDMPVLLSSAASSCSALGNEGSDLPPFAEGGSVQTILHFLIRQTMLVTALPRASTSSLHSQCPACHTLCPAPSLSQAILTEEINTRLYSIFPGTSLAFQGDNYLYWKRWDHPEANSYVEDWDCPNKHCVLKAAATTVTLLFFQKRVAALLCTN